MRASNFTMTDGTNVNVYDSKAIHFFDSQKTIDVNFTQIELRNSPLPSGYTSQAIAVDSDYIYRTMHIDDDNPTILQIFTRGGDFVRQATISSGYFHGNCMSMHGNYLYIFNGSYVRRIDKNSLSYSDIAISPNTDSGDFWDYTNGISVMAQCLHDGNVLLIREKIHNKWFAKYHIPWIFGDYYLQDMSLSDNYIYAVISNGHDVERFRKRGYIAQLSYYGDISRIISPVIVGEHSDIFHEWQGIGLIDDAQASAKYMYISDYSGNVYISENIRLLNYHNKATAYASNDRDYPTDMTAFQYDASVVKETSNKFDTKYECNKAYSLTVTSSYYVLGYIFDKPVQGIVDGNGIWLRGSVFKSGKEIFGEFRYKIDTSNNELVCDSASGWVKDVTTGALENAWYNVDQYKPLSDTYGWVYLMSISCKTGHSYLTQILDINL